MKTQRKKGFTMVELVIVIAVIAILAAVLIPTFLNLTKKADEASALADARNAASMLLANFLKGGDEAEDIVIFTERSGKVYIYGYHAETGSILHYKNNPLDRKESTLADDVKAFVEQLCGEGALQPKGEEYPVDDWRTDEKMSEALSAAGFNADTMIAFATYELIPSRFSELTPEPTEPSIPTESKNPTDPTEKPTDPVHTHTLKHLPATSATCTQPGVAECWVCETCGKMFEDKDCTKEISTRSITEKALGHHWKEIKKVEPDHENDKDGKEAGKECSHCHAKTGCAVIPAHTFGPDHICTKETCQKYEGAVTVKSEDEFLKVVSEAYYNGKTAAIRLGENVTLSGNSGEEYDDLFYDNAFIYFSNIVDLDLNGKTLTANYGFDLSYYGDGTDASLTVRRGTISYTAPENGQQVSAIVTSLFTLSGSAKITLQSVTVDAEMTAHNYGTNDNVGSSYTLKRVSGGIICVHDNEWQANNVTILVENSTLTAAGHCIYTHECENNDNATNNSITLRNSTLITKYCGVAGAATGGKTYMAVYMCQGGTLNIEKCKIAGERNAVFLRCGKATIKDSVLVRPYQVETFKNSLDNTRDDFYEQLVGLYDGEKNLTGASNQLKGGYWGVSYGYQFAAPLATLSIGSKMSRAFNSESYYDFCFNAGADCTLVRTKVCAPCDRTETVNESYFDTLSAESGYSLDTEYNIKTSERLGKPVYETYNIESISVNGCNTGNKAAGGKVIYICGNETYGATLTYDASCTFGNIIAQGEHYTVTGPN